MAVAIKSDENWTGTELMMTSQMVGPSSLHDLVAGIPDHEVFFAWRGTDKSFTVGVGKAAWHAGGDLVSLWQAIRVATAGFFKQPLRAIGWTFFDPEDLRDVADDSWAAFPSREVFVPEVLFLGRPEEPMQRLMICDQARLSKVQASADAILQNAKATTGRPRSVHLDWHSPAYAQRVERALASIESGLVEKVVLARQVDGVAEDDFDIAATLSALDAHHPECFVFAIRPVGSSEQAPAPVFLGASPERLLRVVDGQATTEGLAGSAPRGASESADEQLTNDLLTSEKDRREHEVVCLRIEEQLAPHATNIRRELNAPKIKHLKNVQHLHTQIQADLNPGSSIVDLVNSLHPTPAVCGHPRQEAKVLIRELESFRRGLYAGTAGWVDSEGNGEFCVLIRSALITENRIALFGGAGIVAGSEPDRETEETRVKLEAILECLR